MRVGESIWLCKRIEQHNAEMPTYQQPVKIITRLGYITVQPSGSNYRDLVEYGESVKDYQTAIAQPYTMWDKIFSIGDRVYLDGKEPTQDDMQDDYAENANYEVDSVQRQNLAIRIIFKRRIAQ